MKSSWKNVNIPLFSIATEVGTWWGTETVEDASGQKKIQSADVDIVGLAPSEKTMVVGECQFKNAKAGRDVAAFSLDDLYKEGVGH